MTSLTCDDVALSTIIDMGFSLKDAKQALQKHQGNMDRALEFLLSPKATEIFSQHRDIGQHPGCLNSAEVISCEINQYTFPNGRSACTCIALSTSIMVLKELNQGYAGPMTLKDLINPEVIQQSLFAGVGVYENRPWKSGDVEHMSVCEALEVAPHYAEQLNLIGDVYQGVLSPDGKGKQGIEETVSTCWNQTVADRRKWMAIVMTKPPETIVMFLPPKLSSADHSKASYFYADSHSRTHISTGSYVAIFETFEGLVNAISTIFPATALGPDIGEYMSMMYNCFDLYAFQLKQG